MKKQASAYIVKLVAIPGQILDKFGYNKIQIIDRKYFSGSYNQFLYRNVYWWAVYLKDKVVAYAGLKIIKNSNTGFFCRAGVLEQHRGYGLQRLLIKTRIRKAKQLKLDDVVTYTIDNPISANNLIKCGFLTYLPDKHWSRCRHSLYLRKIIKEPRHDKRHKSSH